MRRRPSVLELTDPLGAFDALEGWLADELRDGESAEVYLGYGLSEPLRRAPWPSPPEPAALPLLAARVKDRYQVPGGHLVPACQAGEWHATWSPEDYAAAVDEVRAAIARGDVYQVNLVQHLAAAFAGDPRALDAALGSLHSLSFHAEGYSIVSATPEVFLARRGRRIWTKPIKGTRPLGEDVDDEKDAAEHVMIVDLERNDLSRVCEPGSIRWPELMAQHELAGVTHLVSTVEGTLRDDVSLADILRATFPGGSITGAPKIAALDHIARLEPVGRGASMGALGTVHANGDFDLALTIRTFAVVDGRVHLWVGGGIVWDSDP